MQSRNNQKLKANNSGYSKDRLKMNTDILLSPYTTMSKKEKDDLSHQKTSSM